MDHTVRIYVVNSFCISGTDGNPAAVCVLPAGEDDVAWMQLVARQMNLSETAFVRPQSANRFSIRWFSPTVEVPLCGHATMAAAHAVYEDGLAKDGPVTFEAMSGPLAASRTDDGIGLVFPAVRCEPAPVPPWFPTAFGISPVRFLAGPGKYLAEVSNDSEVRDLAPNFGLLREVADRGVIVTSRCGDGSYDVVSRYFAAYVGVDEDPVTGSAHCCLGPYWSPLLGQSEFLAFQASPRGGRVRVRLSGDRVLLSGATRTVLAGVLRI